jgi:hypothetical protein
MSFDFTPIATAVIFAAVLVGMIWRFAVRRTSLRHFGMNNVIETLQWQADDVQQAIYSRGTLTRLEWLLLRRSTRKRVQKALG